MSHAQKYKTTKKANIFLQILDYEEKTKMTKVTTVTANGDIYPVKLRSYLDYFPLSWCYLPTFTHFLSLTAKE